MRVAGGLVVAPHGTRVADVIVGYSPFDGLHRHGRVRAVVRSGGRVRLAA